jgi:glutamine cyclotransferase
VAKKRKKKPAKKRSSKRGKPAAAPRAATEPGSRLSKLAGAGALVLILGGVIALWASSPNSGGSAQSSGAETSHEVEDQTHASLGVTIPESLRVRVLARHPHATDAFTQGLLWHGGKLYESTGLEGQSTLREVSLGSGEVARYIDLPDDVFAEGLARVDDELWQLSWKKHRAYRYRLSNFEKLGEASYEGEGWGLCYDGTRLVMSDGSDTLTFRDPRSFEPLGRLHVTKLGRPLEHLNELECHDGSVYANIWLTDEIVRIDPATGHVTASIDASDLYSEDDRRRDGADVLNGIAWLPDSGHFLITGKLWPQSYEVEFVSR